MREPALYYEKYQAKESLNGQYHCIYSPHTAGARPSISARVTPTNTLSLKDHLLIFIVQVVLGSQRRSGHDSDSTLKDFALIAK